ncbi:MAG TPA: hypothetical protein VIW24_22530 [Aldersonia sp.]
MEWTDARRKGLDIAVSEAACHGIEFDPAAAGVRVHLEVLTLPPEGPAPSDGRVTAVFSNVGRLAASLRAQKWDDLEATVFPLDLDTLPQTVASYGGTELHGWEFFDLPDSSWTQWRELLSLDTHLGDGDRPHLFEMSLQEGIDPRELDVRIWFDDLTVLDGAGAEIAIDDFIAGGQRWWDAHDQCDPRTRIDGIAPPL